MIKPQTPAFVYTASWLPGIFLGGWLGGFCFGMSLLGGYYPILVYIVPFIAVVNPLEVALGSLIALPQILPFLGYFKRSVRYDAKPDKNEGKVPPRKLIEFLLPIQNYKPTNGVHYPEMAMYMGFLPFLFVWTSGSRFWFVWAFALLVAVGIIPLIARIPARALYTVTFSLVILATDGLSKIGLDQSTLAVILILHGFMLLRNANIYPSFPFSQWWDRPSRLYSIARKKNEWPYFSGYLEGRKNSDYAGSFRLKD